MLKNKTVVRIISIVLAIGLWAYVIGEVNPTVKKTIDGIPVELTNVESLADRGLALQNDQEYYTEVVVEGSRADLNELKKTDIHITADLYGYEAGDNHVSLDAVVPDGISLEEIKTPEITVTLEKLEEKSLPVTVVFTDEAGENLEPTYASMVPAEVQVRGAASVVAKVSAVRVQLDAAELIETWDVYSAVPTAWNAKGKLVKNVTISAHSVEVEAIMFHTKTVPLELKVTGSPATKYGDADVMIPKEVTVKGTANALERVTSINAQSIDINDVTKDSVIEVIPELPNGVVLAETSKDIGVKVEFK